jgi:hypothetical protein
MSAPQIRKSVSRESDVQPITGSTRLSPTLQTNQSITPARTHDGHAGLGIYALYDGSLADGKGTRTGKAACQTGAAPKRPPPSGFRSRWGGMPAAASP